MQLPHHRSIVGSLASFGVALVVLISTAGAASAQEAPPASSSDEASVGEPLYVERPAPRPDPANELRPDSAPADPTSAAPAPAPAADPTPAPASAPVATNPAPAVVAPAPVAARPTTTPARPAAATSTPTARATEVQGVQIVRSAQPTDDLPTATLARTGADREAGLAALAVVLLAVGAALLRMSRAPRLA